MAYTIKILNLAKTIRAQKGELLADKILESGIDLSLYCQKKAVCGKCFVEILEGYLPPLEEIEDFLIQKNRKSQKYRLACRYKITGDLAIHIPPESLLQKTLILKTGIKMPLAIDPFIKKYFVELNKPELDHPHSLLDVWRKHFRKKNLNVPVNLLRTIPGSLKNNRFKVTAVLYDDNEILAVEPGDTTERSFGLAVDLGTTTLVVELIDLNTGKSIDTATENNSQMKYGMDIVSRISFAYQTSDNLKKLQAAILKILSLMIKTILDRNQVSQEYIYEIVFAGNTAMNHLLLGIPVDTLAISPFHAVFHRLPEFTANELGLRLNPNSKAYVVPNIKSFVGGDISAGLQATDLANRKGNYLFVDLGTNGEIVLKTENKFVATSTAAGPAFEGMNIGSGMLALPGAIYKAEKRNRLILHTIGKEKPQGICGTGLIDLIALFLNEGKITPSGKIDGNKGIIRVTEKISLSQQDIREIQLAVAAVKTGIRMICEKYRIEKDDLDKVFIAGAFGNYLNTKNAMRIGLLPDIDSAKIVYVGNSSLAGARAILLSKLARKKTESLIKKVHYISLASDPRFQQYFIDSLNLGDGNNPR
ncbi:MAG: DUF4445 domain-containing protein [Candidatus Aminicenantes bacterium]|nr:MAG: DUF4445 domain-containing protein [Candidatus Aminicenantes bacterium]